jgi:NAD(P)-dependent dehydrogenase (short-subunit alcohol dehydrogenase family)
MEKVAIITGASRGIGAATARVLAGRGYAVCVNYLRSEAPARSLVDEIRQGGGKAVAVAGDVAVEADVLGRPTALVNNAGILEKQSTLVEMDAARWHRVLATNVVGSFLCAREAVRRMSTARGGAGGAIVNVSSRAAALGSPFEYVDYAASKGAVDAMTVGLAKEVAAEGIRVNAVRPGLIKTDIHASGGEAGRVERLSSAVPMGRGGEALEVANTIAWLLSDEASYLTGVLVDVSGGR